MLDPAQAWSLIDAHLEPLEARPVAAGDAQGQVLAADVAARLDQPFADVSALDGFALAGGQSARGEEDDGEDAGWPIVGESAAGHPPDVVLSPGQAARIMTGAIVPDGADRVIAVERTDGGTEPAGGPRVRLDAVPPSGAAIRRRGEVIEAGATLLPRGTRLDPVALSLLASHGVTTVDVHRRPTVAFMATGDEVVPAGTPLAAGQLHDSNTPFLAAALASMGLEGRSLGIARDDRGDLRRRIEDGLGMRGSSGADVLILCGGVSMGEYDFVEETLDALGCRRLIESVAIQPGKPLVVARLAAGDPAAGDPAAGDPAAGEPVRWIFGLPGNPGSVMTTFWLFVRPLLHRLLGRPDGFWHGAVPAVAADELPPSRDRARFLVSHVRARDGRLEALPMRSVGSHDLTQAAAGTALLRRPPHRPREPAGTPCEILPLVDWPLAE